MFGGTMFRTRSIRVSAVVMFLFLVTSDVWRWRGIRRIGRRIRMRLNLLLPDSGTGPDGGDEDDAEDDGEHGGGEVIHHSTHTNLTRQGEVHRAWRRVEL
jgi:hypothetical protein